jgi:hypothetical protein
LLVRTALKIGDHVPALGAAGGAQWERVGTGWAVEPFKAQGGAVTIRSSHHHSVIWTASSEAKALEDAVEEGAGEFLVAEGLDVDLDVGGVDAA